MSGNTNLFDGSTSLRESLRSSSSVSQQPTTENDLYRISSHPSAVLGALYDVRTESIVGQLQLGNKIITKSPQSKQIQCEVMKAVEIEQKDIFQKVGIDEEFRLNLVLGFFPCEGMATLINYSFPKSSNIRFLYYYYSSETQSISDTQNIVRNAISKDVPPISATHIISSVKLGIQALIVLELSHVDELNLNRVLENIAKQLSRNQFLISDIDKSSFDRIIVKKVFSNIAAISKMTRLLEICQKITEIKQHVLDQHPLEFTLRTIRWYYPNYPKGQARYTLLKPEMINMINIHLQRISNEIEKFNTSFNTEEIDTLRRHLDAAYDTFQQQITNVQNIHSNELKRVGELVIKIRNSPILQEQIIQELSEFFTKSLRDNFDSMDRSLQYLQRKLNQIRKLGMQNITYMHMQRYRIKENDDLKEFFRKHRTTNKSESIYYFHDDDAKDQCEKWMEKGEDDSELILIFADFTDTQYPLPKERIMFIESTNDDQKQLKSSTLSSGTTEELPSSISETTPMKKQESANISEQQKLSKSRRSSIPPMIVESNNQLLPSMSSRLTRTQTRRRSANSAGAHQSLRSENTTISVESHNTLQPVMVSNSSDGSQTKHSNSDVATSIDPSTASPTALLEQSENSSTCIEENTSSPLRASHNRQPLSKQSKDAVEHVELLDSTESSSPATTQVPAIESGETATLSAIPKLFEVTKEGKTSRNSKLNEIGQQYRRPNSAPSLLSNVPNPPCESNGIKRNSSKSPYLLEPIETKSRLPSKDNNVPAKHPTDSLIPSRPSSASYDARKRRRMDLSAKVASKTSNSSEISSPHAVDQKVRTAFNDGTSDSSTMDMRSLSEGPGAARIDKPDEQRSEQLSRRKSATALKGEFEHKKAYKKSIVSPISPEPTGTKHSVTAKYEPNHKKAQNILVLSTVEEHIHAEPSKTAAENLNDEKEENKLSLAPIKYINVLLLGELGVGKSTFINALVNYHKFENFEQARSNEPLVAMPVSFLMTVGDDFDEKTVRFGDIDPNEDHDHPGQSVTQCCRSYVFKIGTQTKLRLIDTPGMGDTRGLEQDDLNMENIISFISNLPHLNAICILLKPNESRLNVVLRSYFTRLLNFLGENARNNIVFCFTSIRSIFFAPGDTGPLLRRMINSIPTKDIPFEKKNTFCFNNETFRYLMAKQNGIQFDKYQEKKYERSWTSSSTTSIKFIEYVSKQLQPYRRSEWQSLEHVQFMIEQLIRPMLESTRNILRNILLLKEKSSEIIILLRPEAVSQLSAICYRCVRTPKRFLDFWILPDNLHTLSDTNSCCSCSRKRHINVSHSIKYELVQCDAQQSFGQMQKNFDQLRKAIIDFAPFYAYVVDSLKQDDALLAALERIIAEEKQILEEKGQKCFNPMLYSIFTSFTEEYKKKRLASISISLPVDLPGLYELIQSINQIDGVKEQMHAITTYQQKYLQQHEKQIS